MNLSTVAQDLVSYLLSSSLVFGVWYLVFRVSCFVFRVSCFVFRVWRMAFGVCVHSKVSGRVQS